MKLRILAKIGGAQLETAAGRADFARAVAHARSQGHELIVVHGGGNQIRTLGRRLRLPERYHDGLRITDAATAEVVLMVLGGAVNRRLVWALERAGVQAAGLSGADGSSYLATAHRPDGHDLGFVGRLDRLRPDLVELLLRGGYVPVLATTSPAIGSDADAPFYNVNADMAAGPLGNALAADVLLFLTDVPGVLDADGALLRELTPPACAALIARGVITGGMRPKIDAALAALRAAPETIVKIAPAAGAQAIVAALQPGIGTSFVRQETVHG